MRYTVMLLHTYSSCYYQNRNNEHIHYFGNYDLFLLWWHSKSLQVFRHIQYVILSYNFPSGPSTAGLTSI